MIDLLQTALTAVELRESELLAWGAVGAEWRREELLAVLAEHGDAEALLTELLEGALVVETPTGGMRSRSAETLRILAKLRQAFGNERILDGRPLVLDYRFLQRPRRRPRREIPLDTVVADLTGVVGAMGAATIRTLMPPTTSAFQADDSKAMLRSLNAADDRAGVVVTAGTGSGKTLAFYLPLLAWLSDNADPSEQRTVALALYPRNELLKDQLQSLVGFVARLLRTRPLDRR